MMLSRLSRIRWLDITRLFAETKKAYGKFNILLNNAGIYKFAPLDAITEDLFHSQFNLNVLGLLLTTQEAVKLIGPEGGSIINISSGVSTMLPPNTSVYSATKAAVDAITAILAKELGGRKIRVHSINPGMIETEGVQTAGFDEGDFRKWIESQSPLGRIGQSDDIAPTAVYLASSDAKYLTGETIRVTGGILQKTRAAPTAFFFPKDQISARRGTSPSRCLLQR